MSGWVCSYRAIWDHPIFKGNAVRVGVWDWMCKNAAWKEQPFSVDGQIITVKRGQLCVSQSQIMTATGISRQSLRTFLSALEKSGAIDTRPTTKLTKSRTLITICNYDKYQARQPSGNQAATKQQPTKEQGNNISSSNEEGIEIPKSAELVEVNILSKACWDVGKDYLGSRGVKNPGALIGRWLKAHKPDELLAAFGQAQSSGTQDPIPYITQILGNGNGNGNHHSHQSTNGPGNRPDAALEQIARLARLGEA